MNILEISITVITCIIIGVGLVFLFRLINRERQTVIKLNSQLSKLKSENGILRKEVLDITMKHERLNDELLLLKERFISTSQEVDPRDLKIGDVFFPGNNNNKKENLYYVSDIKEISFRVEDIIHGGEFNLLYPFDMTRERYYRVKSVYQYEDSENTQEQK